MACLHRAASGNGDPNGVGPLLFKEVCQFALGALRARNRWRDKFKQLEKELAAAKTELARISTCHVCGDVLSSEEGRCEIHAGIEPGDVDLDDEGECMCLFCRSNERRTN
jgi:hypothetical protein